MIQGLLQAHEAQVVCGNDMLDWTKFVRGLNLGLTSGFLETQALGLGTDDTYEGVITLANASHNSKNGSNAVTRLIQLLH